VECILNKGLESSRSIGETKWHDSVLKETKVCSKGHFPFIPFLDPDEVECIFQVNDCEMGTSCHTIDEVVGERKWIVIFFGDGVETSVVDTEMEFASFAHSEENGSRG
jgi:hypothetical protein